MTEAASARRRRPGGRAALVPWIAGLAVFATILVLLAGRMLAGHDPALARLQASRAQATAVATPRRRVIVRRIVRRTIVVTRVVPAQAAQPPAAAAVPAAARVTVAAAPRVSLPPPAAPSPPAPVTRAS